MFAFAVHVSVFQYLAKRSEERLRNDPFCVGWDVKPQLDQTRSQSINSGRLCGWLWKKPVT